MTGNFQTITSSFQCFGKNLLIAGNNVALHNSKYNNKKYEQSKRRYFAPKKESIESMAKSPYDKNIRKSNDSQDKEIAGQHSINQVF